MLRFLEKLVRQVKKRRAYCLVVHGPEQPSLELIKGVDFIVGLATRFQMQQPRWVTFTFGGIEKLNYKTYKFATWLKRGKPNPDTASHSVELGVTESLTDFSWYASLDTELYFNLCMDMEAKSPSQQEIEYLIRDIQQLGRFDYGYVYRMDIEQGPQGYARATLINASDHFTRVGQEAISKWMHARHESKHLGLQLSHYLRDIYPLNFINPHHLAMQVQGQSLKDWIEADPKCGSLKPLIENQLWVWQVPDNRIDSVRKVLGKERLLISWGGFDTPSGGPLGHTYGANRGQTTMPTFNGLPLTEDEQRWIADGLAAIRPIFERYSGESPKNFDRLIGRPEPLFAKLLDIAFTAWNEDRRPDKPSPELVLQAFAATLGEHLVKHFGMAWYAVEDEYGRSLGVVHRDKNGAQTWSHPIDSVAKRIDRGETGFILGVVQAVGNEIKRG